MSSLARALDDSVSHLPTSLAGENARVELAGLVPRIPDVWRTFGFECRLGLDGSVVDLGLSIEPEYGGRDALSGRTGDLVLARAVAEDACWGRLRDFAECWRNPTSLLHEWVPFLFLEYDAESAARSIPVPSVFVALDAPLGEEPDRPHVAAACEAVELLHGARLETSLVGKLHECFHNLPPAAYVLHVGAMLGRGDSGVRISVLLPGGSVLGYLRGVASREAVHLAEVALNLLPGWLNEAQLDFDLGPEVKPRLGFGVRPTRPEQGSWRRLLDELVGHSVCDPEKANAVLAWPGIGPGGLHREISHVKLVSAPGRSLEAKVYLGATEARPRGPAFGDYPPVGGGQRR